MKRFMSTQRAEPCRHTVEKIVTALEGLSPPHVHTCQPSRDYTGIYTPLPVSREFTSLSRFYSIVYARSIASVPGLPRSIYPFNNIVKIRCEGKIVRRCRVNVSRPRAAAQLINARNKTAYVTRLRARARALGAGVVFCACACRHALCMLASFPGLPWGEGSLVPRPSLRSLRAYYYA